jgi:hypothetical protein
MDTTVAFTRVYSKVSIFTGNLKCTRKDQGRLWKSVFMGREGFSKVLNQGLGLLNSLTSEQQFLYDL